MTEIAFNRRPRTEYDIKKLITEQCLKLGEEINDFINGDFFDFIELDKIDKNIALKKVGGIYTFYIEYNEDEVPYINSFVKEFLDNFEINIRCTYTSFCIQNNVEYKKNFINYNVEIQTSGDCEEKNINIKSDDIGVIIDKIKQTTFNYFKTHIYTIIH